MHWAMLCRYNRYMYWIIMKKSSGTNKLTRYTTVLCRANVLEGNFNHQAAMPLMDAKQWDEFEDDYPRKTVDILKSCSSTYIRFPNILKQCSKFSIIIFKRPKLVPLPNLFRTPIMIFKRCKYVAINKLIL